MLDSLQNRVRDKARYAWRYPPFLRVAILFLLLVVPVAVLSTGYAYFGPGDFIPWPGIFFLAGQAAPLPAGTKYGHPSPADEPTGRVPVTKECCQPPKCTGKDEYAEPGPAKSPPAIRTGGIPECRFENYGNGVPAVISPDPTTEKYDYGQPVAAAHVAVDAHYFQDAVFIGDSRTAGFQLFSGPQEATYYTANGLKVDTFFTREIVETDQGKKVTIIDALQQKPFQKVYIMLGINELGWVYSNLFLEKYSEVIAGIKTSVPEAKIYVQSLLPVSRKRSLHDKIYNNDNINKYNELIRQMAAENNIYYLDVAECVADAEGNLAGDASTDGIHLQKTYCDRWLEYLRWHYVLP